MQVHQAEDAFTSADEVIDVEAKHAIYNTFLALAFQDAKVIITRMSNTGAEKDTLV